jgi:hypothetical protein
MNLDTAPARTPWRLRYRSPGQRRETPSRVCLRWAVKRCRMSPLSARSENAGAFARRRTAGSSARLVPQCIYISSISCRSPLTFTLAPWIAWGAVCVLIDSQKRHRRISAQQLILCQGTKKAKKDTRNRSWPTTVGPIYPTILLLCFWLAGQPAHPGAFSGDFEYSIKMAISIGERSSRRAAGVAPPPPDGD